MSRSFHSNTAQEPHKILRIIASNSFRIYNSTTIETYWTTALRYQNFIGEKNWEPVKIAGYLMPLNSEFFVFPSAIPIRKDWNKLYSNFTSCFVWMRKLVCHSHSKNIHSACTRTRCWQEHLDVTAEKHRAIYFLGNRKKMKLVRHVAYIREKRDEYRILVERAERKRPL